MADKIGLGVIGANIHRGWAPRSHLPALVASPEFELTAVCTTRIESAEESARMFGGQCWPLTSTRICWPTRASTR
jgi:predicted dehydrogenase